MIGKKPMVALGQARSRNGLLQRNELAAAAATAAGLPRSWRASLIAGDGAGERFIGAAIALNPEGCEPADPIRRFDGQTTPDHLWRRRWPSRPSECCTLEIAAQARFMAAHSTDGWSLSQASNQSRRLEHQEQGELPEHRVSGGLGRISFGGAMFSGGQVSFNDRGPG